MPIMRKASWIKLVSKGRMREVKTVAGIATFISRLVSIPVEESGSRFSFTAK